MKQVVAALFILVPLLAACGSRQPGSGNPSGHELDKKHCTSNSDCASNLCLSGRCG